jgi:hypothetical protein
MGCCASRKPNNGHTMLDAVVRINGVSDNTVNGMTGTVIRWIDNSETTRDDGGRWLVSLMGSNRTVAIKESSLEVIGRVVPAVATATAATATATPPHATAFATATATPIPPPAAAAAATASTSIPSSHLQVNDRVELIKLDDQRLNGSIGVAIKWIGNNHTTANDGGRWKVRLQNGREVAIRPDNLRLVGERSSPSRPMISSVPAEPDRTDYSPSKGGADSALGGAFSTKGRSNGDEGPPVATAVS